MTASRPNPSQSPEPDEASPPPAEPVRTPRRRPELPALVLLIAGGLLIAVLLGRLGGPGVYSNDPAGTAVLGPIVLRATVVAPPEGGVDPEAAFARAVAEVRRLNDLLSRYQEESEVLRINAAGPETWTDVSPVTWRVLVEAMRYHRLSDGAFDVTVGPLVTYYKPLMKAEAEGEPVRVFPGEAWIRSALERVGSRHVRLDEDRRRVRLDRDGMALDFGAIAKGYAVDRAIEVLQAEGIRDAYVEIGGEVRTIGRHPEGRPWRIRVQDPRRPGDRAAPGLAVIETTDRAVATSGNYEQFFAFEDRRYSHIVDPRTGLPVANDLVGVTVLAPTCLQADALATALSVLGMDAGRKLLDLFPDVEARFQVQSAAGEVRVFRHPGEEPPGSGGSGR